MVTITRCHFRTIVTLECHVFKLIIGIRNIVLWILKIKIDASHMRDFSINNANYVYDYFINGIDAVPQ